MSKFKGSKMRCLLVILTVLCIQNSVENGSINYCGAKMCGHTNSHTFCRYPPRPSPTCTGYMDAHLTTGEKIRVLDRLNRRRSVVANGLRGFPPAGDMLKLRWVEELAREAQRWADQCRPPATPEEYDGCRDLYSITVGQCVASVVGEAPGLRPETMVDMWYMQSLLYKGNITNYVLSEKSSSYYGDFAQMVWSRAYMVGCGRSRFMTPWQGRLRSVERLVCNFAPRGPDPSRAIWLPAEAGRSCPPRSRPDLELPALCAYHHTMDESYDEDSVMSLEEHLLLNTIFEIEKNSSLDYIGSLDEFYLTKLAVATIDSPSLTTSSYLSVQKRHLIDKLGIENETMQNTHLSDQEQEIQQNIIIHESIPNTQIVPAVNYKRSNIRARFIGRPKTYNIDDLDNSINQNSIYISKDIEAITKESDIYGDYEFVEIKDDLGAETSTKTTLNVTEVYQGETTSKQTEEVLVHATNLSTEMLDTTISLSTEALESLLSEMISSNWSFLQILNETSINGTIEDDFLADPESVRQLEIALDRMERKLMGTTTTAAKVRRELRNLRSNTEQNLIKDVEKNSDYKGMKSEDFSPIERNKSLDRGPMLNMVLKYMPILKPYEKSLLGDMSSGGNILRPYFIFSLVFFDLPFKIF